MLTSDTQVNITLIKCRRINNLQAQLRPLDLHTFSESPNFAETGKGVLFQDTCKSEFVCQRNW